MPFNRQHPDAARHSNLDLQDTERQSHSVQQRTLRSSHQTLCNFVLIFSHTMNPAAYTTVQLIYRFLLANGRGGGSLVLNAKVDMLEKIVRHRHFDFVILHILHKPSSFKTHTEMRMMQLSS